MPESDPSTDASSCSSTSPTLGEAPPRSLTAACEVNEHAAAVARVGLPVHEVVGDHAVDQPGEARGRQLRELRQLGHRVPAAAGEQRQHAPALDRASVIGEHLGEPAGDAALHVAEKQHHRLAGVRPCFRRCHGVCKSTREAR